MGNESENQPTQPAPSPNKKFIQDLIGEKIPKSFHNFLINEKKGLREGWFVYLVNDLITAYLGYEHGTHSSDENIKTLNTTIGNLSYVIQSNSISVLTLNQRLREKEDENQKLTTERDKAQVETEIAKNAVASWMAVAQSCNTNTPLTERLDILTSWVAKNTDSLTNMLGVSADNGNTFTLMINGRDIPNISLGKDVDFANMPTISLSKERGVFIQVHNKKDFEIDRLTVDISAPLASTNLNIGGTWEGPVFQGADNLGDWNMWSIIDKSPLGGLGTFNTTTFNISTNLQFVANTVIPARITINAIGRKIQFYVVKFVF